MARLRAIAYIDGFNLYKGCVEGTTWKWLDLTGLVDDLAGRRHAVERVHYFTARVDDRSGRPGQSQRQDVFLRAVAAHCGPRLTISYGQFKTHKVRRRLVRPQEAVGNGLVRVWETKEKASDVNLAAQLVWDACHDNMKVGLVVSNDSDLQTPVEMARRCGCQIVIVNPQVLDRRNRERVHRQRAALIGDATRRLTTSRLRKNQMPDPVTAGDGQLIWRPKEWVP